MTIALIALGFFTVLATWDVCRRGIASKDAVKEAFAKLVERIEDVEAKQAHTLTRINNIGDLIQAAKAAQSTRLQTAPRISR